jgi:hypothetical protein
MGGPEDPPPHRVPMSGLMPKPDELSQLEDTSAATSTAARMKTRETTYAFMIVRSKRKLLQRERRAARVGNDDEGAIPTFRRGW